MISHTLKRLRRVPLPALAVLVFSVILSAVLCILHAANEAERRSYEETCHTIPVSLTVCNLSGTQTSNLDAPGWVADLFSGSGTLGRGLTDYVKDPQIKCIRNIDNSIEVHASFLVGLTSIQIEKSLRPENGGDVSWYDGYDNSTLLGDELVCLAPEGLTEDWDEEAPGQQLKLYFYYFGPDEHGLEKAREYECYLTVAGTYRGGNESDLYCPYSVMSLIYQKLAQDRVINCVSATLADNQRLAEFEQEAGNWFAKPNAAGTQTEWGFADYEYYPYALDIDDDLLLKSAAALETSLTINRVFTLLVFLLSAGAGFLIGFLMIRQRKREISLMRTLGTRNWAIYMGFMVEQMLCVIIGTAIGGAAFGWQPLERLLIFVCVYFVSLTLALIIFLRRNLLATMKEDE